MTFHRDPLRDRPAPTSGLDVRARLVSTPYDESPADLLACFLAVVARYLDSPRVSVAWGGTGQWQPVTVDVDLDAPYSALVEVVRGSVLGGTQVIHPDHPGALPAFGVSPALVPGPAPALLSLVATGAVEYAADVYEQADVERFLDCLGLVASARDSRRAVGRLPLVPDTERDLLAPHDPAPVDDVTLVDLVAAQVAIRPDAVAVRAAGRSLTYGALWERSGALAVQLTSGSLVGVWAERSVELMVALLGILRAGSAYVALEPSYPAARLRTVVELADLAVVVAGPDGDGDAVRSLGRPVLRTDTVPTTGTTTAAGQRPPRSDDLAYVMFTSGSTGEPKGVMVEHRHVVNTLRHMQREPGLQAGDVMLGVTTPAFDLSVPDLFLPWTTGATLALADPGSTRDGARLAALIDEHRPDLMQATPSSWRLLIEAGWTGASGLRVVCGGEAYDAALVRGLVARTAGVWNFYGPTETTVWSMSTRLHGVETDPLPLGRPMRAVDCYLLDSRGEPVPRGVRGEIAIAGAGVTRGYLGREDLTAAAFVACDFPGATSDRMYLTGDLARLDGDGRLRFAGRRDHQVKLNGFRVELGEVEAALHSLPDVAQAVAVVRQDNGPGRLVGYVVPDPGAVPPSAQRIREALTEILPPQSVPTAVMVLHEMPLSPNGKVDRARLPAPGERRGVPLTGEFEVTVASAFAHVLAVPVRYADDDVFALGADSLLVGRIAIRLTEALGIDVTPGLVFRHPTVGALAEALLARLLDGSPDLLDQLEARSP